MLTTKSWLIHLLLALLLSSQVICDASGDTDDDYLDEEVDEYQCALLESDLSLHHQKLHSVLESLINRNDNYYEAVNDQVIVDQIHNNTIVVYGWFKKIKNAVKKVVKAVGNVVKSVAKGVVDEVKGLVNKVKTVVNDVVHIRQTIVNTIKGLENEVKAAVTAVKKLPGKVVGALKNAWNDAKNVARDVFTLHINAVKKDLEDIAKKLAGTLTAVLKAELENAKKILEGDLKAALEAWALAALGPFGAAIGELLEIKQTIENYKDALLDKLNLAKQLGINKITDALKKEIADHFKIVNDAYQKFNDALHGKIETALKEANAILGGVPTQIKDKVEHAIDMIGIGFKQAKDRIEDLEHQLELAVGDVKTQFQTELKNFIQQHGDVLRKTEAQLIQLKTAIEAKLKTVTGDVNTVLQEMHDRIEARLDELKKFEDELAKKLGGVVTKVETVFQEMARKSTDLMNTLNNLKNLPTTQANQVIAKLTDVQNTESKVEATLKGQLTGTKNILTSTIISKNAAQLKGIVGLVTNYLNMGNQVSTVMNGRLKSLQDQLAKVIANGGSLKQIISLEIQKQLEAAKVVLKNTLTDEVNYIKAKLADIEKQVTTVPADIKTQLIDVKNRLTTQLTNILKDPVMQVVNAVKADYTSLKNLLEKTKTTLTNPLAQLKKLGAQVNAQLQTSVLNILQVVHDQYQNMVNEIQSQLGVAVKNALPTLGGVPQTIKTSMQPVLDFGRRSASESSGRLAELRQQASGATGALALKLQAMITEFVQKNLPVVQQNTKTLVSVNQQIQAHLTTAPATTKPVLQDLHNQINQIVALLQAVH